MVGLARPIPSPDPRRKSARARLVLALAVLALSPCAGTRATAASSPPTAVRFTLTDVRGQTVDLGALLRHGPVLLDFWATWCGPCVESLPELEAWHRRYGPLGLSVVGISIDGPRNFARVRPFVASHGLTYPILLDRDGRLQQAYQVLAVPTAVLIDTAGVIVQVRTAYRPGEGARLEAGIRALLPRTETP